MFCRSHRQVRACFYICRFWTIGFLDEMTSMTILPTVNHVTKVSTTKEASKGARDMFGHAHIGLHVV